MIPLFRRAVDRSGGTSRDNDARANLALYHLHPTRPFPHRLQIHAWISLPPGRVLTGYPRRPGPPLCCLHQSNNNLSYRIEPNQFADVCSLDQPNHSLQAMLGSIEEVNSRSEGRRSGLLERNDGI